MVLTGKEELEARLKELEDCMDSLYVQYSTMKSDARFLVYKAYKQLAKACEQLEYEIYDKRCEATRNPTLRADGTTVESTSNSNKVENDRPKACPAIVHDSLIKRHRFWFCPWCGERLSS